MYFQVPIAAALDALLLTFMEPLYSHLQSCYSLTNDRLSGFPAVASPVSVAYLASAAVVSLGM